ncbi:MAG TPA: molybdopterin-dependent oxidoreductase, partial [Bacillota bacterium]|nr:molybdopterin-dependent oxidoreductase [Bacillota bacterium]
TDKLKSILRESDPRAILHLSGSGAEGLLQSFDKRFFNVLGGVSRPSGSMCWGSGFQAQLHDFGGVYSHSWSDILNARTIILWGRDPMVTNLHLVPYIKKAKAQGAAVIVINPMAVESVTLADHHLAVKPGTDGALAMAMCHVLLDSRTIDFDFVGKHVEGFGEFAERAKECSPEWAETITGIPAEKIRETALLYGKHKPSTILLGYGLQRYANSGQAIRAIDALAALTGNLGIPGGGVNYAHQYWQPLLKSLAGEEFITRERRIPYARMASGIMEANDPPIKAIFVSKMNPITQLQDSNLLKQAFRKVDFKVVLDFFLNDTAEEADLFLPVATSFEQKDIMVSSWNEYGVYAEEIVPPRGEAKTELEIFSTLAEKLGVGDQFGRHTREEWLSVALAPMEAYGIGLKDFKSGAVRCPDFPAVAWEKGKFATPSGKYQLVSVTAKEESGDALPGFAPLGPLGDTQLAREYPLQLMTPHAKFSMHSSFYTVAVHNNLPNYPQVLLHYEEGLARYLATGDLVIVETELGELTATVQLGRQAPPGVAVMLSGSWIKDG